MSSPAHVASSSSSNDTVVQGALGNKTPELRRGHREKFPSMKLQYFVTHTVTKKGPSPTSPASKPSSAISERVEPQSFKETVRDAGWSDAMQKEICALEDNNTWSVETLPPRKKTLGSKWVYKIKYNSDGSIDRLKARFVFFGNHQVECIGYNETSTSVAKMVIVHAFLTIAASKN
ncbi:uncharacterized mitochondrial protein AtMg00820-like [Gossypium hirsutum]|uniref:Uncharacterized mitochondrial protein AtMg00820-like n=1 Tax=Gossypium hirsutum TaxID=3635 RepID=A0A1U8JQZ3_GOSHI|nr:uncharacterized mitochondrial protein AtMg00820-like [Gossypium hirsutum]